MNIRRIYDATAREKDYLAVAKQFPHNIYAQLPKMLIPLTRTTNSQKESYESNSGVIVEKSLLGNTVKAVRIGNKLTVSVNGVKIYNEDAKGAAKNVVVRLASEEARGRVKINREPGRSPYKDREELNPKKLEYKFPNVYKAMSVDDLTKKSNSMFKKNRKSVKAFPASQYEVLVEAGEINPEEFTKYGNFYVKGETLVLKEKYPIGFSDFDSIQEPLFIEAKEQALRTGNDLFVLINNRLWRYNPTYSKAIRV